MPQNADERALAHRLRLFAQVLRTAEGQFLRIRAQDSARVDAAADVIEELLARLKVAGELAP